MLVEIKNIKCFFKARDFYLSHKNQLFGVWGQIVLALNEIGVHDEDIGIFGSYLIGFEITKDVDFVVYGDKNLRLVYKNIDKIKQKVGATSISQEHIDYQYNKHKDRYNSNYDLKKIISRNWSGIQIRRGVLSTLRFVEGSTFPCVKRNKKVKIGSIKDALSSAYIPRKVILNADGKEYIVYTNLWKLQSFASEKDIVEINGNVDEQNNIITVEEDDDYIKFLN